MQLLRDPKLDHKTKIISNLAPKKIRQCPRNQAMPFFYDQGEEKCNLHVCIPLQKEREKCLIIYAYIEEEKFDAYIITLL